MSRYSIQPINDPTIGDTNQRPHIKNANELFYFAYMSNITSKSSFFSFFIPKRLWSICEYLSMLHSAKMGWQFCLLFNSVLGIFWWKEKFMNESIEILIGFHDICLVFVFDQVLVYNVTIHQCHNTNQSRGNIGRNHRSWQ